MSQYRSILKATSIFGGTQIIQMMVSIIRGKFVALLIGSAGMGLSTMYMSTLTMIITIFGLGLGSSVVKDLSKSFGAHDMHQFSVIAKVYRRLLVFLAIIGSLFVIAISSYLSEWAFETTEHKFEYCFLSLIVFFSLLSSGNNALLVSTRRIKDVAACNVIGSVISLITCVPLFYFYRVDGIVPGLIVSTFANYVVTWFFARKVKLEQCRINTHDIYKHGYSLITLGVSMTIAILVGQFTHYCINISVSRLGGLSDLGFYNAAVSITTQVISMVFAAMSSDYFPRLAASMDSQEKMSETINEQSEILLYLAVPILIAFMVVAPIVIKVLLSDEFLVITTFIRIVCFGMILKVASYALGTVSFAKGDKKVYLLLEAGYNNIAHLVLSVSFYYLWGLIGLAYSFVVDFFLYYIIISIVDRKRYHYIASRELKMVTAFSFIALGMVLVLDYFLDSNQFYIIASIIALITIYFYILRLNKKTNLIVFLKSKWHK